jgi:hypothetical protein
MAPTKIERVARQCESGSCTHHRRSWRLWLEPVRGYSVDGHWYCSPECFERALVSAAAQFLHLKSHALAKPHRVPLGLLMLSRGLVDNEQLKKALQAQKESGTGRVGEWLRHICAVNEEQVTQVLGLQWSIPVFPLSKSRRYLECAQLVPISLLEVAEMIPVHRVSSSQDLFVAFVDRVNYSALYALEKMLDCHTEPCLAVQSHIIEALNELRQLPRPVETLVKNISDPGEMASSSLAHARRLSATDVKISGFDNFVWARLLSQSGSTDILFQVHRNDRSILAIAEAIPSFEVPREL